MTAQTDGEGGGFTTDSTIPDASSVASMKSSLSTRSSRSGLTRQGNCKIRRNFQFLAINGDFIVMGDGCWEEGELGHIAKCL